MVAFTSATLGASIATAVTSAAVSLTASLAINALFAPKGPETQAVEIDRKLQTNAPRQILVGKDMVPGVTMFEGSYDGPENNRLGMYVVAVAFSSYDITGFDGLWIDNENVTLDGDPMTGLRGVTSHYLGKDDNTYGDVRAWFRLYSGAEGQNATAELRSWFPSEFTAADRYDGMCIGILRCRRDAKADEEDMPWRGAFPSFRALLRGAPILNVRTGVTEYSNNPADVWYANQIGFARGAANAIIVGCGVPAENIDLAAAQDAADYFESRQWTANGLLTSGEQLSDNQAILDVCNAVIDESGGKIRLFARRARPVSDTLDVSKFEGTAYVSSYDPQGLSTNRFNAAITFYKEPNSNYLAADTEQINDPVLLAEDNGNFRMLSQSLEKFCTSRTQAEEIQSQDLLDGRNTRTLTVSDLPAWFYFAPNFDLNNVITFTGSDYAHANDVEYEIVSKTLSGNVTSLTLLEYTSAAYVPPAVISPPPPVIPILPWNPVNFPFYVNAATQLANLNSIIAQNNSIAAQLNAVDEAASVATGGAAGTTVSGGSADMTPPFTIDQIR